MKEELIRFKASDNIELVGLLYSPEIITNKIVIHVHGLTGNFYEKYINFLAEAYVKKGYAFFAFNNRSCNYITDFIKNDNSNISVITLGATFELFEESYYDIEGAINYSKSLGYNEFVIEGHSYGCNKVIYYYSKSKENNIQKIILLAPCDHVGEAYKEFGEEYFNTLKQAKELLYNNNSNKVIDSPIYPLAFSAKTFIKDYNENTEVDIFRYRTDNYKSQILTSIKVPILIIIGSEDKDVYIYEKNKAHRFLNDNLPDSKIIVIEGSGHTYRNKESEVADIILSEF